jgi:cold-inducible RNA-binding protein
VEVTYPRSTPADSRRDVAVSPMPRRLGSADRPLRLVRIKGDEQRRTTRLYVGNLSPETTPGDLRSLFGQLAQVVSVEVVMRPASGLQRCFGFVELETSLNPEDVIYRMRVTEIDGRSLRVREAQPKTPWLGSPAAPDIS